MRDYRSSVFLPQTDFPMRGELPKKEPALLTQWIEGKIYDRIRQKRAGKPKFVLHDGPPFANGNIHIGHAFNKCLKDTIMKMYSMEGYDTPYVPGWDCHGLPIEWKVEESYRAKKLNKDDVPIAQFRKECRDFAQKWVDVQAGEFKRLGVLGDWDNPYITMDYSSEAAIVQEISTVVERGMLYQGYRPVMWSVVEKTALAEAEVEYKDHTSPSVHIGFPVITTSDPDLMGAKCVIWTTTPWTMPGNRAIAYGEEINYVLLEINEVSEGASVEVGQKLILADALKEGCLEAFKAKGKVLKTFLGTHLQGVKCHHPLHALGYTFEVPLLPGDHVTTDAGTGLVHTAPGHGLEDFAVGKKFNLELPRTVSEDGTYYDFVPHFGGQHIFKANATVMEALTAQGNLLAAGTLLHSYPHSWRSKAPLIYRTTSQWFVGLDQTGLRKTALKAIDDVEWIPAQGKNRIGTMVETRPDWCISRQRTWGVPIAIFLNKATGEPLVDKEVQDRIVKAVREEGADTWFTSPPSRFLGDKYPENDYTQVKDIVDVWFESGSTHAFVLEARKDLTWPADLYLEGSDQHRGWFQSSLLESCATRGKAPYKQVLTHGFVVDGNGRKMSKSLGNVVAPEDILDKLGADVLRLWVVGCDYTDDQRLGQEILKRQEDIYRRLRNTLRFLLGALHGYQETETLPYEQMPDLEKWVLGRLQSLNTLRQETLKTYDLQGFYSALHTFCSVDLSAFYFDIRKDTLYCDTPDSSTRRGARTVMNILVDTLIHWLAPVLSFTAEEAYQSLRSSRGQEGFLSIHESVNPTIPEIWKNEDLLKTMERARSVRHAMTAAIEIERAAKTVGSSLEATLDVYGENPWSTLDWAEFTITSDLHWHDFKDAPEGAFKLEGVENLAVVVHKSKGTKCLRCWKVLEEVHTREITEEPLEDVCNRCATAVTGI